MRQRSEPRTSEKASPQFERLVAAHRCEHGSAATLVLAATAARNGLTFNGAAMADSGAAGRPAALRWIARETGLSIDTVRAASKVLLAAGEVSTDPAGGLRAVAEALAERWTDARRRVSLDRRCRTAGLGPNAMLLVGLVAWSAPAAESGTNLLRLGVGFLAERIGCSTRAIDRALAAARHAHLITTETQPIPGAGYRRQLLLAHRKSSPGTQSPEPAEPIGNRRPAPSETVAPSHGKSSPGPIGNRRAGPSVFVGRLPEVQTEVEPESPPERQAPAAPAGDPVAARPVQQQQAPAAPAVLGAGDPAAIVERFVTVLARRGVDKLEARHAADVAGLLDALGPPTAARDRAALARERLRLCTRVVAWCPSPERLGRWLLRVRARFGVQNLGAYLRRASERGDAGTVLDSQNRVGRAAETWQDFSSATERVLEGPHAVAVQQLVAGGAAVLMAPGDERDRLRAELRRCLAENRRAAARAVLLKLLGPKQDDMALARAIGDVCAVSDARALLQEVA